MCQNVVCSNRCKNLYQGYNSISGQTGICIGVRPKSIVYENRTIYESLECNVCLKQKTGLYDSDLPSPCTVVMRCPSRKRSTLER